MLNKNKLVYDPQKGGDITATYIKGADGTLISKTESSGKIALDVHVVNNNSHLFTKPFDKIMVLSKNEGGEPTQIKSQLNGSDVQLITIIYDVEGDFLSLEVSNY